MTHFAVGTWIVAGNIACTTLGRRLGRAVIRHFIAVDVGCHDVVTSGSLATLPLGSLPSQSVYGDTIVLLNSMYFFCGQQKGKR